MASVSCVLSQDQFLCSICLEVFSGPVTTPCGHSFCCTCINKHWDTSELYFCPVCKEEFSSRPVLKTNTFMLDMLSEFKNKPRGEELTAAESGVLCDMCPDPKLQALKSCLMCQTSYCPLHLQPHLTVPRLQKHQLIAAATDLEERVCAEHARPLELFCRDHSELICVLCSYTEHRDHNTVLLKEQCEEQQKHLQQEIQERRDKVQEILKSVQLSQKNADREMEEGVKFFNDLMECVQQSLDQFKLNIEEKHEEIKTEADELILGLVSEISELEQRQAEIEEPLKSADHFDFVQFFTSAKPAPELQDWTEKFVRVPLYKGRVTIAVSKLKNRLNTEINTHFETHLKEAKQHAVEVTLDPDTAHPNLQLSHDYKQVLCMKQKNDLPDTSERFSKMFNVLGKQKFASGRFYFEVQVKEKTKWHLGMTEETADRKLRSENLTPDNGYWKIHGGCKDPLWSAVEKVGVFVDYDEGLVAYFDAETSTLIHSITDCRFTGNILPLLCPGSNSLPLILTPVKR
ncbi:E3 ubiquitin-protein ligase TRIM39-like [Boleophthalmus pectinirostris]|uniref:E3 ubiquitin-protein ligase TRIM39-like n=1 Tax=Boleophthalmus pectinirostris TaxID=150288 RepID=UPI00242ED976|nr:E3 ubiquitin-protein ligase TRIM39-like [Boleophthalmus pectinirostris]XP_055014829.1 E3 ubiquitin-protein ligase TRIM39-like [Boleophthalmus pectinirostris]